MGYAQGSNTVNTANIVDAAVTTGKIADEAVTLAKLKPTGTSGQVLTSAGTGADPSYQTAAASDPAAFSGAIETDGTFVATTQPFTMPDGSGTFIATVKDAGANSTVELWAIDASGVVGGSAAASVTLTGAATPTSIAESMGYVIVGSEDGISIIDSYDGSWAERTVGWPRSLSSSTVPLITNNDVTSVAAGVHDDWPTDPRTGGKMPCFAVGMGTGADTVSLMKFDGNVYDYAGTVGSTGVSIDNGCVFAGHASSDKLQQSPPITTITADDWTMNAIGWVAAAPLSYYGSDNALDILNGKIGAADPEGLSIGLYDTSSSQTPGVASMWAVVNRAANSGFCVGATKGKWLANSATADLSPYANTMTAIGGGPTEVSADGATGELKAYTFSTTKYVERVADTDFDMGTGDFGGMAWVKIPATANANYLWSNGYHSGGYSGNGQMALTRNSNESFTFNISDDNYSTNDSVISNTTHGDDTWDFVGWWRDGGNIYVGVNGVVEAVTAVSNAAGTLTNVSGSRRFRIGQNQGTGYGIDDGGEMALFRFSATAPSAAQFKAIYDAEVGMFETAAKVLLQSATTDAVLDVSVDPNGKVAVTQTDSMTIWDGLVATTQATSGSNTAFEHLKSWNDTLIEVGAEGLAISRPAENIRAVVDRVDVLESEFAGVDLSKAKAWCYINNAGTIFSSYNIESVSKVSTGRYRFNFGTHFKSNTSYTAVPSIMGNTSDQHCVIATNVAASCDVFSQQTTSASDQAIGIVFFGELEGE